jgi:hypothetical protein
MTTLLFLDDWPLHHRERLVRRQGVPRWVPEATLEDEIVDGTWNYPFVFHDAAAGVWRALYQGVSFRASDSGDTRQFLGLLYAESPDGIRWEKPDVSGRAAPSAVARRRRPNQVFSFRDAHSDGGPVFLDPVEGDAGRRLKFLFSGRDERNGPAQYMATSPEGVRWSLDETPWRRGPLDAPITAFWNRHRRRYVVSCRPAGGDRRVALTETTDFRQLSPSEVAVHPDPLDPPLTQLYGMPVYPYENLYLGLLNVYHADPVETGHHKLKGYVDGGLTYSYDGWRFNRAFREPFLPRNERGEPGGGGIYPSTLLVDADHRVRIYSAGGRAAHFQTREATDAALLLHTLRLDGFIYLAAEAGAGSLTTRRLRLTGPDLSLNVRAPYGRVRVQLCEPDGSPIPGFTYDECVPFTGDDLFYRPVWQGGHTAAGLASGPERQVKVAVELLHGDVYALRGDFELVVSGPPPARTVGAPT